MDASEDTSASSADARSTAYDNLCAYNRSIVSFRFQTLGFFLAAVGLIAGHGTRSLSVLLLGLALGLWGVELRNRTLLDELGARGRELEDELGHPGYFHAVYDKHSRPTVFFGTRLPARPRLTHTLALDVIYAAVVVYALYGIIVA
ncbi:MAG TPA: hypothetical protein VG652_01410 [Gaiellaceae bacterium]|nr:hypothetical protein [Gaiellaceae bacterium]